jgi:hypothetical protein
MAHFAKIEKGIVTCVIVVDDSKQSKGAKFCKDLLGGKWLQTSYNGNIRKNYAGIGYTYNKDLDAFIAPEPSNSTGFNELTCKWIVPETNTPF